MQEPCQVGPGSKTWYPCSSIPARCSAVRCVVRKVCRACKDEKKRLPDDGRPTPIPVANRGIVPGSLAEMPSSWASSVAPPQAHGLQELSQLISGRRRRWGDRMLTSWAQHTAADPGFEIVERHAGSTSYIGYEPTIAPCPTRRIQIRDHHASDAEPLPHPHRRTLPEHRDRDPGSGQGAPPGAGRA